MGSTVSGWLGWFGFFLCSNGEKPFSVGLVDQLFQPASNHVETVEKVLVLLCRVIVARVRTIPRSYRVSTANGWKSVLLRNVSRINPNRLQLKRLIPIEHDLRDAKYEEKPFINSCFGFAKRLNNTK